MRNLFATITLAVAMNHERLRWIVAIIIFILTAITLFFVPAL